MGFSFKSLLGAAAISALIAAPASAAGLKAEVLHWWTSGGESAAVKQFADSYNKNGGEWIDTAIAGGPAARAAGINRIVGGDPPTAMQFNISNQFDDLVKQGLLANLDDVAAAEKWKDLVPAIIYNNVVRDGHIYAVPVNLHGQYWLWYNTDVLKKLGVEEPKTWDEFFATADKMKAAGIIPLAFSGQPNWIAGLFYAVMLRTVPTPMWEKVFKDKDLASVNSADFKKAVDIFGKLRNYVDAGHANRNWNDATALVMTGKAGFQFMGDWAKGEFIAANQTVGKEYNCTLGPGIRVFAMGGDNFVFPLNKDPEKVKAQKLLAKLMLSPETQVAFNNKKGSVPVRPDVDTSKLDACAQTGIQALTGKGKEVTVPTNQLLARPDLLGAMQDVIAKFWTTPTQTSDDFVKGFEGAIKANG
jgi:glucose/mannose transport system substrate-binding protein